MWTLQSIDFPYFILIWSTWEVLSPPSWNSGVDHRLNVRKTLKNSASYKTGEVGKVKQSSRSTEAYLGVTQMYLIWHQAGYRNVKESCTKRIDRKDGFEQNLHRKNLWRRYSLKRSPKRRNLLYVFLLRSSGRRSVAKKSASDCFTRASNANPGRVVRRITHLAHTLKTWIVDKRANHLSISWH